MVVMVNFYEIVHFVAVFVVVIAFDLLLGYENFIKNEQKISKLKILKYIRELMHLIDLQPVNFLNIIVDFESYLVVGAGCGGSCCC